MASTGELTAEIHSSRRAAIVGALLFAAAAVAPGSASGQAAHSYTIVMANMNYGPVPANLRRGDTILWVNRDGVPHTVTARDRSFDLRVPPGRSASLTLRSAGTIPFYCIFHAAMRGTLRVS